MDIKVGQTQAITNMNSQNTELQVANQKQLKVHKKEKEDELIKQLEKHPEEKKKISEKELNEAIKDLNKKFEMLNSQLKIEIDKDTGITVVKIIDKETNKVIRQIPPEVVLKIAKYLNEVTGLLFNEKV